MIKLSGPRYAPYLFLLPFAIVFAVFIAWPLLRSLFMSFTITSGPGASVPVGLDNYRFLLSDPDFWLATRNTLTFAFFTILLQVPLSLGLALLLNRKGLWLRNTLRFAFFSPHLMGLVFAAILFTLLFAPLFGLVNIALHNATSFLGDHAWSLETRWLGEARWVMPALILVNLWLYVGYSMIYFLAALQAVDRELYEAARVDGAGPIARFWHVTLPGIRHVLIFVVVLSTIGSFQLFELPYLLLNNSSGPEAAGLTLVMYLYQNGFVSGDLGYASAIGWTLVVLVLAITLVQLYLTGTGKKGDAS
ncbi:MAG: sugar ABC transporter permease [Planctomycetota bacterium]|nr:MAG: sugar ABC transporter permease [Planctomycetota bacterium]